MRASRSITLQTAIRGFRVRKNRTASFSEKEAVPARIGRDDALRFAFGVMK
jgi:hypothetical protein